MYTPKTKGTPNSPSSQQAVRYFRHFPTSFLKPYGLADKAPTEATILKRVNSINCEWLRRPQTGISEFAETIEKNTALLAETSSAFLQKETFATVKEQLSEHLRVLQKFNTKADDHGKPTAQHVKRFLQLMLTEDDEMDNHFKDMMEIGGAMYLLATHYLVIKGLLSNPAEYANKGLETFCLETEFKQNPTVKGMKTLLTRTCVPSTSQTPSSSQSVKRNLVLELDSDDDTEVETERTKKKAKKGSKEKKGKK